MIYGIIGCVTATSALIYYLYPWIIKDIIYITDLLKTSRSSFVYELTDMIELMPLKLLHFEI